MGVYHLIAVAEDQLRNWQGDPEELLRNLGSAVVLACLDPENKDVSICADVLDEGESQTRSVITVNHIDKSDADEFSVWVWTSGNDVCVADLPDEDLTLIGKLVDGVLQRKFATGDRP